eukprot:403353019
MLSDIKNQGLKSYFLMQSIQSQSSQNSQTQNSKDFQQTTYNLKSQKAGKNQKNSDKKQQLDHPRKENRLAKTQREQNNQRGQIQNIIVQYVEDDIKDQQIYRPHSRVQKSIERLDLEQHMLKFLDDQDNAHNQALSPQVQVNDTLAQISSPKSVFLKSPQLIPKSARNQTSSQKDINHYQPSGGSAVQNINNRNQHQHQFTFNQASSLHMSDKSGQYLKIMNDQINLDHNPSYDLYNSQEQIEVEFLHDGDQSSSQAMINTDQQLSNEKMSNSITLQESQVLISQIKVQNALSPQNKQNLAKFFTQLSERKNEQITRNQGDCTNQSLNLITESQTSNQQNTPNPSNNQNHLQNILSTDSSQYQLHSNLTQQTQQLHFTQTNTSSRNDKGNLNNDLGLIFGNDGAEGMRSNTQMSDGNDSLMRFIRMETVCKDQVAQPRIFDAQFQQSFQSSILMNQQQVTSESKLSFKNTQDLHSSHLIDDQENGKDAKIQEQDFKDKRLSQTKPIKQGFNYTQKLSDVISLNLRDEKDNQVVFINESFNKNEITNDPKTTLNKISSPVHQESQKLFARLGSQSTKNSFASPRSIPKQLYSSRVLSKGSFRQNKSSFKQQEVKSPISLRSNSSKRGITLSSPNNQIQNYLTKIQSNSQATTFIQQQNNNPGTSSPRSPIDLQLHKKKQIQQEVARQKIIEEKEMDGFTGKPQINKNSQSIRRRVDDLIQWKMEKEKRRDEESKRRQIIEYQQMLKMQSQRHINKKSQDLLKQNGKSQGKVEERLMRDASNRRKKRERENNNGEVRSKGRSQSQKRLDTTNQIIQVLENSGISKVIRGEQGNQTQKHRAHHQILSPISKKSKPILFSPKVSDLTQSNQNIDSLINYFNNRDISSQKHNHKDSQYTENSQKPESLQNFNQIISITQEQKSSTQRQLSQRSKSKYQSRNKEEIYDSTKFLYNNNKVDYLKRFKIPSTTTSFKDHSQTSMPVMSNLLNKFNHAQSANQSSIIQNQENVQRQSIIDLADTHSQINEYIQQEVQIEQNPRISDHSQNISENIQQKVREQSISYLMTKRFEISNQKSQVSAVTNNLNQNVTNNGLNSSYNSQMTVPFVSVQSPNVMRQSDCFGISQFSSQKPEISNANDDGVIQSQRQSCKNLFNFDSNFQQPKLQPQNSTPQLQIYNQNLFTNKSQLSSKFKDHQAAIINKILDNSQMPSGSAYKMIMSPSRTTFLESNAKQKNQATEYKPDLTAFSSQKMLQESGLFLQLNQIVTESQSKAESPLKYQYQNEERQNLLSSDKKLINNHSNNKNLNLDISSPKQAQIHPENRLSRTCRNSKPCSPDQKYLQRLNSNSNQKSDRSSPNSFSNLKNLKFMDRNNQWIDMKRSKLQDALKAEEIKLSRECPFKPNLTNSNEKLLFSSSERQNSKGQRSTSKKNKILNQDLLLPKTTDYYHLGSQPTTLKILHTKNNSSLKLQSFNLSLESKQVQEDNNNEYSPSSIKVFQNRQQLKDLKFYTAQKHHYQPDYESPHASINRVQTNHFNSQESTNKQANTLTLNLSSSDDEQEASNVFSENQAISNNQSKRESQKIAKETAAQYIQNSPYYQDLNQVEQHLQFNDFESFKMKTNRASDTLQKQIIDNNNDRRNSKFVQLKPESQIIQNEEQFDNQSSLMESNMSAIDEQQNSSLINEISNLREIKVQREKKLLGLKF